MSMRSVTPRGSIVSLSNCCNRGGVEPVVDIRSIPRSRTNPRFNLDALPETLSSWQAGHKRIALGGRRNRRLSPVIGFWTNQSFHNYANLRIVRRVTRRLPDRIGPRPAVRNHLFGSGLVALS